MKKTMSLLCSLIFTYSVSSVSEELTRNADLIIANGNIIDGNGSKGYTADIAIKNNRIVFIGNSASMTASRRIDARGLTVSPGFIDGHSHTGEYMVDNENRLNENTLMQGVTTIVFGADGMYSPTSLKQKLDRFEVQGIGTNVGFYVGHNGIRKSVMNNSQQRAPTKKELSAMTMLVHEGMRMGAVGMSTGLMYEPGMFSQTAEIIELGKAVAEYGGIYDSHVRNPIHALIASDTEAIEIGRKASIATKIAHVKAVCLHNAGKSKEVVELVNDARAHGQHVVTDQYPYNGAKTDFLSDILLLPQGMARNNLKPLLKSHQQKQKIRNASENGINGGFSWLKVVGYSCIRITHSQDYPQHVGKYLSEIAQEKNIGNFDAVSELLLSAQYDIRITLGGVSEKDVRKLMVQPWNMIASDGKYINARSSTRQHPRSTGTFARVLGKYVRENALLSLEQAIKKMTSQPADFLGFSDRGRIKVGNIADIAIFNSDSIIDQSDWADPLAYAKGVHYVLVNGVLAVDNGTITERTAGTLVKRTHKTSPFIQDANNHLKEKKSNNASSEKSNHE